MFLRCLLEQLAWIAQLAELAHLLRREDIFRALQRRPLQDQLLQKELLRRNESGGNVFLLRRHTGMRIGEAADLSFDCINASGADQWTIHVRHGRNEMRHSDAGSLSAALSAALDHDKLI